jgi:hypothetical protein
MIFYCDGHNTTHDLTTGQTERVVYALSGEVASASCELDGDRIYAGENAWEHFPCVLDYLGLSNSPEGYLELVDPWVDARRAATPAPVGQPDEATIVAAADTYGIAPDEFSTDDVRTALSLWEAIKPQFDPNDAWEYTEIGPLLRTFLTVLTKHRPEHFAHHLAARENDLTRELYQAVYPGDAWPDRPLDTVWNHLLEQIRAQSAQQLVLRAATIRAADRADDATNDNAHLLEIIDSLQAQLRETITALNAAKAVPFDRVGDFALLRIAESGVAAAAREQSPRELVAGLRTLLDQHSQDAPVETASDGSDEAGV